MKAIRYNFSIPNYLAVRAADKLPLPILESGRIPGLTEIETEPQPLPGPEWLRLKPRLCGVCGSDISMLKNTTSPAMLPFSSFPAVPGHEIVADVTEVGAAAGMTPVGERVVVNPLISCEMRGLVPCRSCASGEPGLCTSSAEGKLAPGMLLGFCRDLPGGWSEELVVHRSQAFPVPDALSDATAVLVEPFSVAVHAVLKAPPPAESKVLIVGAGSIGLLVLAALRLLGNKAHVTVLARHPVQEEMARRFGADVVLRGTGAGDAATQVTGAKRYKPIKGKPVYAGGFDWVFDAVGSARSVDESLRVAGPHGRVVLVGCAGEVSHLDLSFVWARELQITGCYVYGKEPSHEGAHTFEVAMRLLADHPDLPLGDLVTHTVPLANWREAMRLSLQRGQHGAIKVVFDCRAGSR
ncbi:MAG TPA: zinc-binding dehydrogenase [Thermomicrobiales bacterium]|jgi:threonine dehydrogenase-like Zn-dependent dehydrogenase